MISMECFSVILCQLFFVKISVLTIQWLHVIMARSYCEVDVKVMKPQSSDIKCTCSYASSLESVLSRMPVLLH